MSTSFFLLEFEDSKNLQNGLWRSKSEPYFRVEHFDILYVFSTSYAKFYFFITLFCKTCRNLCFLVLLTSRCSNITTSQRIWIFEVFIIFFVLSQNWNGDRGGGRVWWCPTEACNMVSIQSYRRLHLLALSQPESQLRLTKPESHSIKVTKRITF